MKTTDTFMTKETVLEKKVELPDIESVPEDTEDQQRNTRETLKQLWKRIRNKTVIEKLDELVIHWLNRPEKPWETKILNRRYSGDYLYLKPNGQAHHPDYQPKSVSFENSDKPAVVRSKFL